MWSSEEPMPADDSYLADVQADFVMRLAAPTATCQASPSLDAPSPPHSHRAAYIPARRPLQPCMHTAPADTSTVAAEQSSRTTGLASAGALATQPKLGAACSGLGLRGAVDVTLVILHVSEETSVARQLQRAEAALAHNAQVAASGCGECMCALLHPSPHALPNTD